MAICSEISQIVTVAKNEIGLDVTVLPAALSVWFSDVAWGTLTDVGAHYILTHLTTDKGCLLAFINVIATPFVSQKLVTRKTRTIETGEGVRAVLVTATEPRVTALVNATSFLITVVQTVI